MRASPNALRAVLGGVLVVLAVFVVSQLGPSSETAPPTTTTDPAPTTALEAPPPTERVLIQRAARTDPRPDILLFTIDTLRADHLSSYGYERATSPTIDALAARGTRFERAYAASTWTVPSVASIVTGVLPSAHGVQHGLRVDAQVLGQEVLSPSLPTFAAELHAAGYRTVGVTANVHLTDLQGFGRGFDSYACLNFATLADVRPRVAEQLDGLVAGDTPYLLWVHLVEPHAPYVPTGPIFDTFWPPDRPRYPFIDTIELAEFLDARLIQEHVTIADGIGYAVAAYDSEVRAADDYLAELLARIDDGHLVVVVAADHGEEFHDHFRLGHGHTAFDEVARVPLVIAVPGQTPGLVPTPVSLIDLLPTLVDVAQRTPPEGTPGRSLLPATRGEALELRDLIIETGRSEVVQAIVAGRYKYGERVSPDPVQGLFDLEADPREMHNLLASEPDVAAELRLRMQQAIEEAATHRPASTTAPIQLTDEQRAQLRALGYGN